MVSEMHERSSNATSCIVRAQSPIAALCAKRLALCSRDVETRWSLDQSTVVFQKIF